MSFFLHSNKIYGFVIGFIILVVQVQAQSYNQDSLLNTFQSRTEYYYIKPVFGLHWSYLTKEGAAQFSKANRFDVRNPRYGLVVGYHTGRFSLETGIITLPVYTGYQFTSDDNLMVGGGVRVTYWQFPLNVEYTLWQPLKNLQLRVLAGVAFNTERGESLLPPGTASSYFRINPSGDTSTIKSIRNTHYRTQFGSATIGLGLAYQVLKRIDLSVQVNRLFSTSTILQQDIQLQQNSDPTLYQATTNAGAGGLSIVVGLSYRFNVTKSYRPSYKLSY